MKFNRADVIIITCLILFSAVFRLYGLKTPDTPYFDEHHYVNGAKAFLSPVEQDPNYIHPPLGKMIIVVFIRIFGDNPAGWRAGSVVFGLMMIPLIYLLGLSMFKNQIPAFFAAFLLSTDFLHVTMSRICLLDIFQSFFYLAGFYFTYLYFDLEKKPFILVTLSGLSFACAQQVKLSGVSGAFGSVVFLVVMMTLDLIKEMNPTWKYLVKTGLVFGITGFPLIVFSACLIKQYSVPGGLPFLFFYAGILLSSLSILLFMLPLIKEKKAKFFTMIKHTIKILGVYVLLFTFVFLLVHVPFLVKLNRELKTIKEHFTTEQKANYIRDLMFYRAAMKFHYTYEFRHRHLSNFWQWPTLQRPMWFLGLQNRELSLKWMIYALGNPLFWWPFIPVFIYLLYAAFVKEDKNAIFITVGYLSLYLFWITSLTSFGGVWRLKGGFFYYMLPCVPFMALSVASALESLRKFKVGIYVIITYFILLTVSLIQYMPILAGIKIPESYFNKLMIPDVFGSWI